MTAAFILQEEEILYRVVGNEREEAWGIGSPVFN